MNEEKKNCDCACQCEDAQVCKEKGCDCCKDGCCC